MHASAAAFRCVKSPTPPRSRSARSKRSNATTSPSLPGGIFSRAFVRSYASEVGLDPDATIQEFIAQFPNDSVIAGHPGNGSSEDHVAVESDRRTAGTFLWLIVLSLPIAGGLAVLRDRRPPRRCHRRSPPARLRRAEPAPAAAPSEGSQTPPPPAAVPAPDPRGRRRQRPTPPAPPVDESTGREAGGQAAVLGLGDRRRRETDRSPAAAGRASRQSRCGARWW